MTTALWKILSRKKKFIIMAKPVKNKKIKRNKKAKGFKWTITLVSHLTIRNFDKNLWNQIKHLGHNSQESMAVVSCLRMAKCLC